MSEKQDIQSLGLEISNILRKYQLPTDDFHLEFHLSTDSFSRVSISWQHFSEKKQKCPTTPKVDFNLFDDEIFMLLKSFNYFVLDYGLIIGIPENNFDTYIRNYPEELSSVDVIRKTGNKDGIDYYYLLQKRRLIR